MGIFFCQTENCAGYFCSVDMSSRPHAPHCELYVEPQSALGLKKAPEEA